MFLLFYVYDTNRIAKQGADLALKPVILREGYIKMGWNKTNNVGNITKKHYTISHIQEHCHGHWRVYSNQ